MESTPEQSQPITTEMIIEDADKELKDYAANAKKGDLKLIVLDDLAEFYKAENDLKTIEDSLERNPAPEKKEVLNLIEARRIYGQRDGDIERKRRQQPAYNEQYCVLEDMIDRYKSAVKQRNRLLKPGDNLMPGSITEIVPANLIKIRDAAIQR